MSHQKEIPPQVETLVFNIWLEFFALIILKVISTFFQFLLGIGDHNSDLRYVDSKLDGPGMLGLLILDIILFVALIYIHKNLTKNIKKGESGALGLLFILSLFISFYYFQEVFFLSIIVMIPKLFSIWKCLKLPFFKKNVPPQP